MLRRLRARRCSAELWPSLLVAAHAPSAQQKPLTLDDIYGPAARVNFSGAPAPAFAWIDGDSLRVAARRRRPRQRSTG